MLYNGVIGPLLVKKIHNLERRASYLRRDSDFQMIFQGVNQLAAAASNRSLRVLNPISEHEQEQNEQNFENNETIFSTPVAQNQNIRLRHIDDDVISQASPLPSARLEKQADTACTTSLMENSVENSIEVEESETFALCPETSVLPEGSSFEWEESLELVEPTDVSLCSSTY